MTRLTTRLERFLVVALIVGPAFASADEPGSKPLYLHWYKPNVGTPAALIASVRVVPSIPFDCTIADPTRPSRKFTIRGRIDATRGSYDGNVDVQWFNGEEFRGSFALEKPRSGTVTSFASAVIDTRLVLSRQADGTAFVADDDGDDDSAGTKVVGKPDLVADLRIDSVTRWNSRSGVAIAIGQAWFVARAKVVRVVRGTAGEKGIEVVFVADARSETILGFGNQRTMPIANSRSLAKPERPVEIRVRLIEDRGLHIEGDPPTYVPVGGYETPFRDWIVAHDEDTEAEKEKEEDVSREELDALVDVVRNASYYALRDPEEKLAIAKLRAASEAAAPVIAEMLSEGLENRERGWIQVYRPLFILEGMGEHADVALKGITKALDDEHAAVVSQATRVLVNLGPDAKRAIPALLRTRARFQGRKKSERWVRQLEKTIWTIDSEAAEKAGLARLDDSRSNE